MRVLRRHRFISVALAVVVVLLIAWGGVLLSVSASASDVRGNAEELAAVAQGTQLSELLAGC